MFQATYKLENALVTLTCYDNLNPGIYYITITYTDEPRIDSQRVLKEDWDKQLRYCVADGIFLHSTSDKVVSHE